MLTKCGNFSWPHGWQVLVPWEKPGLVPGCKRVILRAGWESPRDMQCIYNCSLPPCLLAATLIISRGQGGRSCAKAWRAFAKKFEFGRKFEALTYAFYCNIKIHRDSHTFWKTLAKKRAISIFHIPAIDLRGTLAYCRLILCHCFQHLYQYTFKHADCRHM